jgi:DME family drug/metabolite transporter
MEASPQRLKGVLLVVLASLCWSSAGVILRHTGTSGIEAVFWRSIFMALAIGLFLLFTYRSGVLGALKAVGRPGLLSGSLLAASFIFFILALTSTKVANAYVLMSASPLVSALMGRLMLGERLGNVTWGAIVLALLGIALMVSDELGGGGLMGDLFAFAVALCFGFNVVLLRKRRAIDMVPASFLGGVISALVILPFAHPWSTPLADLPWLAALGFFQLAAGLILFTKATPHLKAAEASLLTLIEAITAPFWVWLVFSETPSLHVLMGGGLVLAAVVAQTLLGQDKRERD